MTAPYRLLSVKLQGFKSFADRTHVAFGPGISAVVGPNGSGKSNLADALRWALGEQGRALRSRRSEDVIWAGSEKRPAVGMADVQLTLDNADALLPVEYGVVELGRRLYRSGENDYLLNRQRVRLKDLVDLLDAGHLAENAFLFIGQGMVDQALALRPEERRPLFEEVAGVRRHERRRRRAEEQLAESEVNLARVEDILAELRPQARRLAQQAEQQANRRTAADDLATAILGSAHVRWHEAARRSAAASAAAEAVRTGVAAILAELGDVEAAIATANAALTEAGAVEAARRGEHERLRNEQAALRVRAERHAAEVAGIVRERERITRERATTEAALAEARKRLSAPLPASERDLEDELADIERELAGEAAAQSLAGTSEVDASVIRRLESARAAELASARRRAADAAMRASEERQRAARASDAADAARDQQAAADAALATAATAARDAAESRAAAQAALVEAESAARAAADRAAAAGTAETTVEARLAEARRALDAARGDSFDLAARAAGGRSISEGLAIDPGFGRAVDAVLAELGRAQLVARDRLTTLLDERGVVVVADALVGGPATAPAMDSRSAELLETVRGRGGGRLRDALVRDESGATRRLLARAVWLPDAATCLALQDLLPPGWTAVARDGSIVVGEVTARLRPEGHGRRLEADVARLTAAATEARALAEAARATEAEAQRLAAAARTAAAEAREREGAAVAAQRAAEELARAAAARAETTARDAAWLTAQADRLEAEASRLHAAIPPEPAASEAGAEAASSASGGGPGGPAGESTAEGDGDAGRRGRRETLERRRDVLTALVASAASARRESERQHAAAEAAVGLAERQLAGLAQAAADAADREARLALEREDATALIADADRAVAAADVAVQEALAAATAARERLRAAEVAAAGLRDRLRAEEERGRAAEREELEARLGLESLREQVLVELAGLGPLALRHLGADVGPSDEDVDPAALEAAVAAASVRWHEEPPSAEPPSPARIATLRRRFHDLGAANPFAAEEYAEAKSRLDGLETQRSDLAAAIEHTRALITQLDQLIGDQFRRTFTALERAFDERFQQLFGGGYARLSLTDPEDLAATGIEIVARPPGKKPQALAMLSGGERALTAVALLFAMLEVRPVPFCVLDEVDAALDEANIGRFTDALRDLARTTQCIVITHNRGTIETADALYGVTVGDDSVSRVISLRLEEATALADRSRRQAVAIGGTVAG